MRESVHHALSFTRHDEKLIGISLGDVTGVGPEVTLKPSRLKASADETKYLIIGDEGVVRRLNTSLGLNLPLKQFSATAIAEDFSSPIPSNSNPGKICRPARASR